MLPRWLSRVYNADGSHAASCQRTFAATLQVFPFNLAAPRTIKCVKILRHRQRAWAAISARQRQRWHHSHQYYNNNSTILTESHGARKGANNESSDKIVFLQTRNRRYLSSGDRKSNVPSTTTTTARQFRVQMKIRHRLYMGIIFGIELACWG